MSNLKNRGKEGRDDLLFGTPKMQDKIKEAITDMCYLLSRGYAQKSSIQLVGNKYRLNARQQQAVQGMSASKQQIKKRQSTCVTLNTLKGQDIIIDGFNLIIILESALSQAYIFKGLDNCYRDLSGVYGTYKRVQQTEQALLLIGSVLKQAEVNSVLWVLDKPVSNSGRLKTRLRELAEQEQYNWNIILENNPDKYLAESASVIITSDAWILDRAETWCNIAGYLIEQTINNVNVVNSN
jgi:hypothetical protein